MHPFLTLILTLIGVLKHLYLSLSRTAEFYGAVVVNSPTISAELKIETKLDLDNTDDSLHGYTESRRVVFFSRALQFLLKNPISHRGGHCP